MSYSVARQGMRAAMCAALLCTVAVPVFAQSSQPVEMLKITVTGKVEPSLTVPSTQEATRRIEQTPGAVEVVPDTVWRDTAATTMKDMLEYTPGVLIQPKWGEDSRLSIRGSGLSRNFHMRGVHLYQDGIPMNAADGSADFQELDPTAYRYVEVYKGGNALRYGANALGGAVNFVTPSGHDASAAEGRLDVGSFGFRRLQVSSGAADGDVDGYVSGSFLTQDGFRDHSGGESKRASGNFGWRLSANAETRFYLNVTDIQQDIPGSVTKQTALTDPKPATAGNLRLDYQRNMESVRFANKTTVELDNTVAEFGGYAINKNLIHPIYQYLDYTYNDVGAFARATNEHTLFGHANALTFGVNVFGGWLDNRQYVNNGGNKGALLSGSEDRSFNIAGYAENGFDITPDLTFVTGVQLVHATRERVDEVDDANDTSGEADFNFINPKVGLLWQVDPSWQVFTNVSRSGQAPTFSEVSFASGATLMDIEPQYATTFEIGTRGEREDFTWDLAVYRAHLENEYQYFNLGGGNYRVVNADETIHQGIEAAVGWAPFKGLFTEGPNPDRLWINTAYTFSDFRFEDDPTYGDNDLPGAPRHFLRAELLYKSPHGFYAGPNVEWVPEAYYVDNENTQDTEAYALLGFKAGYAYSQHLSFFVDARNLTDEKYIATTSVAATASDTSALYEPGVGRAVYAGLRLTW